MSLTNAAIKNSRVTSVALFVIIFVGLSAYSNMPKDEDPGFTIRTAMVLTYFPGASPERIEMLVTDKLEKAIQEMPELDFISSVSKTGVSELYVNIQKRYKKMRPIWDSLRRKVDKVRSDLPEGVIGPFVNDEFGDVFGTIFAITGDGFSYAELKEIADEVRDELLRIDEVAKVTIHGAQEERIFVEFDNARLAELGLSPLQLQRILESRNIVIPGGSVRTKRERITLEPSGSFESVDELRSTLISLPMKSQVVALGDVARVYRGYIDPPDSRADYMGQSALVVAVNLREGGNIIELGAKVREEVESLETAYPVGIDFEFFAFQAKFVDLKIKDFENNLLQAVVVVLGVMLVSLGFRTGFVVAALIPSAMIMSLVVMSLLDIWINQVSLAALIIALGMLVDNAIVMSESIMVQMQAGKKALDAAVDSAAELRIPLLTSSLTTAAAFLPMYLAKSDVGEYVAPLFKVVSITLLCSWVLALTLTPLMCVTFLKVKSNPEKLGFNNRLYRRYRGILINMLKHPVISIVVTLLVFMTAMYGFGFIPNIFFPPNDKPVMTAEFWMPPGTPIEITEEVVGEIEDYMNSELVANGERTDGIINWATFIGAGAPRFVLSYNPTPSKPEYAIMIINTTSNDFIPQIVDKLENFCLENFPDLQTKIKPLDIGPPVDFPVEVRISGRDIDEVFRLADKVKAKLASIHGTKNIKDDWGTRTKKLLVKVNEPRARRAGITNFDVALSLQTILSGIETTQYREGDKVIPITLRSVAADRDDVGKLESHNIYVQQTGKSVPLKQVADIETVWQPAKVLRRDRLRTVTIKSGITSDVNAIAISLEMDDWLRQESESWGVGYKYELGGEMETSAEANQSIADQLPIAGFIIVMLLVLQFNSLRKPLIIMMTIPLGLIGVSVGLLVLKSYFGFMTLLGIISLSGIVINNAIVLLERIKLEMDENGLSPQRAVIEAAQRRMRPILLTTATTIGGLIPLYLGGGPMWEPMTIAIMFGLLFATTLTLGFVPVLYSILFRIKYKDFDY